MAQCIRTGAYLFMQDYGTFLLCDLHQLGTIVFADTACKPTMEQQRDVVTHNVRLGHEGYFMTHDDRTVLIVPQSYVEEITG